MGFNVIGWFVKIDNYQGSWLDWLQTGSWFWSFGTAFVSYYVLMTLFGKRYLEEQVGEPIGGAPRPASVHA